MRHSDNRGRSVRIVPALIIFMGLLLAGLLIAFVPMFIPREGVVGTGGQAVDSQARIEMEYLRSQVDALSEQLLAADELLQQLDSRVADLEAPPPDPSGTVATA